MSNILHVFWHPDPNQDFLQTGGFRLWIETAKLAKIRQQHLHPRHFNHESLGQWLKECLGSQAIAPCQFEQQVLMLPTAQGYPLPCPELMIEGTEIGLIKPNGPLGTLFSDSLLGTISISVIVRMGKSLILSTACRLIQVQVRNEFEILCIQGVQRHIMAKRGRCNQHVGDRSFMAERIAPHQVDKQGGNGRI